MVHPWSIPKGVSVDPPPHQSFLYSPDLPLPAANAPPMSHRTLKLLLAGDVMLARGIDAILEHSVNPALHEECVKDARVYVQLAERAHGPLPPPLPAPSFSCAQNWMFACQVRFVELKQVFF